MATGTVEWFDSTKGFGFIRKPWNGVRRPVGAPGMPLNGAMLLGGIAVLFGAAGTAIDAARARRF